MCLNESLLPVPVPLFQCDIAVSPMKRWDFFLTPLNLGWLCNLLWPLECNRGDTVKVPEPLTSRLLRASTFALLGPSYHGKNLGVKCQGETMWRRRSYLCNHPCQGPKHDSDTILDSPAPVEPFLWGSLSKTSRTAQSAESWDTVNCCCLKTLSVGVACYTVINSQYKTISEP